MSEQAQPYDTGINKPSPIGGVGQMFGPANPKMLEKFDDSIQKMGDLPLRVGSPTVPPGRRFNECTKGIITPVGERQCIPGVHPHKRVMVPQPGRSPTPIEEWPGSIGPIEFTEEEKNALEEVSKKLVEAHKHASHKRPIPKGKTGQFSKLIEEFEEARDAYEQNLPIMMLWEFCDLLGAMERFLQQNYPGVNIEYILNQARHTNRLFADGLREDRDPK
jgi:hypothetical protein